MNIHSKPFTFFEQMCIVLSMHKVSSNQGMKPWTNLKELGFLEVILQSAILPPLLRDMYFTFHKKSPFPSTGNPRNILKKKLTNFLCRVILLEQGIPEVSVP
jgi:hypothetical protein